MTATEPPLFHLEFTYDFKDYDEASSAHSIAWGRVLSWAALAGWLLLFMLVVLPRLWWRPLTVPPRTLAAAVANLVIASLPLASWLLLFTFIWLNVFLNIRPRSPQHVPAYQFIQREPLRVLQTYAFIWVVVIEMAVTALVDVAIEQQDARNSGLNVSAAELALNILLRLIPAAVGAVAAILVVLFNGFGRNKSNWNRQPHLQLAQRYDFFVDYLVNIDSQSATTTNMSAYRKVIETPTLFLLYKTNFAFEMIPKRAFVDNAAWQRFREYLKDRLPNARAAFPVIAAQP